MSSVLSGELCVRVCVCACVCACRCLCVCVYVCVWLGHTTLSNAMKGCFHGLAQSTICFPCHSSVRWTKKEEYLSLYESPNTTETKVLTTWTRLAKAEMCKHLLYLGGIYLDRKLEMLVNSNPWRPHCTAVKSENRLSAAESCRACSHCGECWVVNWISDCKFQQRDSWEYNYII